MSTTRPLLGMKRVTELNCSDQPTSRLSAAGSNRQQEPPMVDEFTVLEDKQEELKCAKPRVEQVFKVAFTIIGLLDHTGQAYGSKTSRQIWLQLKGNRDDVSKAKVSYIHGCIYSCSRVVLCMYFAVLLRRPNYHSMDQSSNHACVCLYVR